MRAPTAHEQLASLARFRGVATAAVWWARGMDPDPAVRWLAWVEIARRQPIHRRW